MLFGGGWLIILLNLDRFGNELSGKMSGKLLLGILPRFIGDTPL